MRSIRFLFLITALHCFIGIISCSAEHKPKQDLLDSGFRPTSFWDSMKWKREDSGTDFRENDDVKTAEKNFSHFCETIQKSPKPNYEISPTNSSIPPIIHFIWLGSPLTAQAERAIASWKKYHPSWKTEVWTDERVRDFPWTKERLYKLFQEAGTWAEKADILRLDILYQFGGIYSDVDVICLRSFHDLVIQDITFFSCFELNYTSRHYGAPFFVGTAVMGSSKGSAVIKYCLDHCQSESEAPRAGILKRTGPGLVSRACQNHFVNPEEKILILPCSYLYPFPWMSRKEAPEEFIAPESFAIHLWNYSWES